MKYRKVRDLRHYIGEYRGTAHSICDLKYSVPKKIPIVFYDGSYYDDHFTTKLIAKKTKSKLLV